MDEILLLGCQQYKSEFFKKNEKYIGGTPKYVFNLVSGLQKKYIIHLITINYGGQKNLEQKNNLIIYKVFAIKYKFLRSLTFNISSFFKAISICIKSKIDIIHCHSSISAFFGLGLSKIFKIPIMVTPHGSCNEFIGNKIFAILLKLLNKIIYPFIHLVIFLNEKEMEYARKYIKLKKYAIIYSGIKLQKENIYIRRQNKKEKFQILYVGRLAPVKKIDRLIKAISLLPKKIRSKIVLKLVGFGNECDKLKKLVKSYNLIQTVFFEGFKTNVDEYYKDSDLFMLISDSEGFPISLLEAMSFGLPCIINNFGLPISRDSLYIINDNNPENIAESIEVVYENSELQKSLSKNAFEEIKNKFSFEKVVEKHLKIYESVKKESIGDL